MHGVVILAAGAGARLGGRNKAALRLPDGRRFVEAILDGARAAGVGRIVVVVGPPHGGETRALVEGVALAENPAPERGMLSSLVCGLDALGDVEGALSWPVDHPFVRVETVAAILAAALPDRAVVPSFHGRGGHPTYFGAALFARLRAAATPRDVLGDALRLPVDDPGVARDVDHPGDVP